MAREIKLSDDRVADVRLACLKCAVDALGPEQDPIDLARRMADFVFGTGDAEVIASVRELARRLP